MEQAVAVVEQKEVQFYGDTIVAVRINAGGVYVPVRPICHLPGVDWSAQRQRLSRDAVLSTLTMSVVVTTTDMDQAKSSGRRRPHTGDMLALPLDNHLRLPLRHQR